MTKMPFIIEDFQIHILLDSIERLVYTQQCYHNRLCEEERIHDVIDDIRRRPIASRVHVRSITNLHSIAEHNQQEEGDQSSEDIGAQNQSQSED